MSGLTAWQFLIALGHDVPNPLQPQAHRPVPLGGKTVLVNGAAGGVGHLAVQLAKWQGAHVIAVASGTHESFLRGLGADEFIDYTENPPEEVARDVDLVLDTLGGPTTGRFLRTLRRGGALFPLFPGFSDAEEERLPLSNQTKSHEQPGPGHLFSDLLRAELGRAHAVKPIVGAEASTLASYLVKVARLGGYLARTKDPPPGHTVIWRGLCRLADLLLSR